MKDFNSYFESIPELETERLRLTAFTREDMDAYGLRQLTRNKPDKEAVIHTR